MSISRYTARSFRGAPGTSTYLQTTEINFNAIRRRMGRITDDSARRRQIISPEKRSIVEDDDDDDVVVSSLRVIYFFLLEARRYIDRRRARGREARGEEARDVGGKKKEREEEQSRGEREREQAGREAGYAVSLNLPPRRLPLFPRHSSNPPLVFLLLLLLLLFSRPSIPPLLSQSTWPPRPFVIHRYTQRGARTFGVSG